MSDKVRFVVDVSKSDLMDLALNLSGDQLPDNVTNAHLAQYLKDAIIAGLEEYLGEETTIEVYPAKVV